MVATHRNLEQLVESGSFRRYHRVVVFPVEFPPLRKRRGSAALVDHFVRQVSDQNGWKPVSFNLKAIQALQRYSWPGNIRESCNVVERLLLLADGEIDAAPVAIALPAIQHSACRDTGASLSGDSSTPLAQPALAFERSTVLAELERHHRHITQTARALGLAGSHIYKKRRQLGIDLQNFPDRE